MSDEREHLLAEAARLVGAEHEGELRELVEAHERQRWLGDQAPTLAGLQDEFDHLTQLEGLSKFGLAALDPDGPVMPGDDDERRDAQLAGLEDPERLRVQLDALSRLAASRRRRVRATVPSVSNGGNRRADVLLWQGQGGRWHLLRGAAEIWEVAGHLVGIGPTTRFFAFAVAVLRAAGEPVSESQIVEVARRWRAARVWKHVPKPALSTSPAG
jgi:hypothetical protein